MPIDEAQGLIIRSIDEIKDSIVKLHDRIDKLYNCGFITRVECEKYREQCPATKNKGVGTGTTVMIGVTCSLISLIFGAMIGKVIN